MEDPHSYMFKFVAGCGIFLVGLIGGFLPIRHVNARIISLLNITSGGIFLAGGIIHLFPEAQEDLEPWETDYEYPFTALFAAIGLLIALIVEEAALAITSKGAGHQPGGVQAGQPFLDKNASPETEVVDEAELGLSDLSILRSMSQVLIPRQDIVYRDVFSDDDPSTRRKQGFLMKRGRMRKNWQKRWIVLDNASLSYLVAPGGEPKGKILLEGAALIFCPESKFNRANVFEIASVHRSLYLCANNPAQMREWGVAITEAIFCASQNSNKPKIMRSAGSGPSAEAAATDAPLLASDTDELNLSTHLRSSPPGFSESSASGVATPDTGGWDHEDANHGHTHGLPAEETSVVVAIMLLIALSFHSVMAGLALGAHDEAEWGVLIAIVSHKGLAAFALGTSMVRSSVPVRKRFFLLVGFSCTTPLGIAIGSAFSNSHEGPSASAVLLAGSAGTFLYVALFELIPKELSMEGDRMLKLFCVIFGFGAMALLALWT